MGGGVGGGKVEVIAGKGCSRIFLDLSSSFRGISSISLEPLSPASAASTISESNVKIVKSNGPFSGLVICVTGLSKETRKQVKEATERLGVRLDETLYNVNKIGDNGIPNDILKRLDQNFASENSSLPVDVHKHTKQPHMIDAYRSHFSERESKRQIVSSSISGQSFYIDNDVPAELRSKVAEAISAEGAILVEQWFVGCNATHVVCEGPPVQKYLGHSSNLVTPYWVLKSAKEKSLQRLVHLSADLARYTGAMLDTLQHGVSKEEIDRVISSKDVPSPVIEVSHAERKTRVNLAKDGVRKRRNRRMQTCQTPIRPITPGTLLDSICWSISEPTSTASIYTESSSVENATEDHTSVFLDSKESETSFVNLSRPLTESEKSELIFKGHFLTIMFPVDRFSEMGPCSRTFFSNNGFTCLQVLDYIYAFYQARFILPALSICHAATLFFLSRIPIIMPK
ncbi:BRCT domain-containing DNA repair protein [Striga asiatica]|uniref:BRCT domain-containing DNA repair protein n=1 Tax=Striga asiatica TaxID=4170 RepID=A0A5A7PDG9_STRAF|nr:BRCT domain-containing DNA repair protein [Striga asiatica]